MSTIKTHYDEELNREFNVLSFETNEVQTGEELMAKYPVEVFVAILQSLEVAIDEKLPHVPCFMIGDAVLHAEKYEYAEKLKDCMTFFLKQELYEYCEKVLQLQKKLNDLEYQLTIFTP